MIKTVVDNGVITMDDGQRIKFHPKCPKCGFVNEGEILRCTYEAYDRTTHPAVPCKKCGASINFVITRVKED